MAILGILLFISSALSASEKIDFWDSQRNGANFFNNHEKLERFEAAKGIGIEVVRLAPNKWLNGRSEDELGDFLIGSNSENTVPVKEDVDYLISVLDDAEKSGIKVVLTMLSLPGNRWTQHNNGTQQRDIWKSFEAQNNAIKFWTALASKLKNHPAVAGYNIKNEPSPERTQPHFIDWYTDDYEKWYKKVENSPADLNLFYSKIVKSIRSVDSKTPIVLDSGFYATPWAFKILKPLPYDNIIYSLHMYEPFAYTSFRSKKNYTYPGKIPTGEEGTKTVNWNKKQVEKFFRPVRDWQKRYNIPDNRIFLGEFGVCRYKKGAAQYLSDIITIADKYNWHWAFYSFREDAWQMMDYELGTEKPDWLYWQSIEQKKIPDYSKYKPNKLFNVIERALND